MSDESERNDQLTADNTGLTNRNDRNQSIYKRLLYAQGVIVFCIFLVALGNIWYTDRVDKASNQKFCDLVTAVDVPPGPHTAQRNRDINAKVHRLSIDLGCVDDN